MKVAYLYSRFPVVSQTFCLTEMLALERQGVDISVASIYAPADRIRHGALAELKAEVAYSPSQSVLKHWEDVAKAEKKWPAKLIKRHDISYGSEYKAGLRARNALFFADRFARWGVDHFHVHFANRATHTAIFLKRISGIPFSFTAHAQDFQVQVGSNHALLREMCEEAKFVVAVSDYSRELLSGICPKAEGKIVHIYNGIEPARFGSGDATPAGGVPKIVSIGRLINIKGFQHLISACDLLKGRGVPFECEIIGQGPLQAELEELIAKEGLEGQVRLVGGVSQEEVARRLIGCTVFALACVEEPDGACDVLPTVILEAMAAARPVVSTRLAGVPEMVEHGRTGLLVAPGSEGELADALSTLLGDPALCRQYGLAGRRKAESAFRVEETASRLKALFERDAEPKTTPAPPPALSACLLPRWPGEGWSPKSHEASTRVYAFEAAPPAAPVENAARRLVKEIEFLPEASVLEAEWTQDAEGAGRIDSLRAELGPALDPVVFQAQAMRALWLRKALKRENIAHVQAVGSEALLAGWILKKLDGVALNVSREGSPPLPESCLQVLLAGCNPGERDARLPGEAKMPFLHKLASVLGGTQSSWAGSDKPE